MVDYHESFVALPSYCIFNSKANGTFRTVVSARLALASAMDQVVKVSESFGQWLDSLK